MRPDTAPDAPAPPAAPAPFSAVVTRCPASTVRAWALAHGIEVASTGGLPRFVYDLYLDAHPDASAADRS